MQNMLSSLARLLGILLLPMVIGFSAQTAAVDVFPLCDPNNPVTSETKTDASKTDACLSATDPANAGKNPIIGLLKTGIAILSIIIGVAAVIMIILAGLAFITANGDAQSIAKARGSIIYALVGIVIVVLAQALVAFVLNKL